MECQDCTRAAAGRWDCYSCGCADCEKRMLARMVDALTAVRADEGLAEESPS